MFPEAPGWSSSETEEMLIALCSQTCSVKKGRFPSWPQCHSKGKKVPPVFHSDKTSAPPPLSKSRARKWDYGEYPPTGTCSFVIFSSTQNKELCCKTKLLSAPFPLPVLLSLPSPFFIYPYFSSRILPFSSFPFPHSLPLLHLFSNSLSPALFLLIVCWADLGLACTELFTFLLEKWQ